MDACNSYSGCEAIVNDQRNKKTNFYNLYNSLQFSDMVRTERVEPQFNEEGNEIKAVKYSPMYVINVANVASYNIGLAFELLFKAALFKQGQNFKDVMDKNHNLERLWKIIETDYILNDKSKISSS